MIRLLANYGLNLCYFPLCHAIIFMSHTLKHSIIQKGIIKKKKKKKKKNRRVPGRTTLTCAPGRNTDSVDARACSQQKVVHP